MFTMRIFSLVTEMNKVRLFKFHPVAGLECSYGKISSPVTEIAVDRANMEIITD